MPLDLPDGSRCFVDSNIFYYALIRSGAPTDLCSDFFSRVLAGSFKIATSVPALSDVLHKVMLAEIAGLTGRDRAGLIGYLGRHPQLIAQLTEFPKAIERLSAIPMEILPVDQQLLADATSIAMRHHLLTNDSLIVALMHRHQLGNLVTNDDDFDAIATLNIWKPR